MAVVVLRLDPEEVSALAECLAGALERDIAGHREVIERLLRHLRLRQVNSKHSSVQS